MLVIMHFPWFTIDKHSIVIPLVERNALLPSGIMKASNFNIVYWVCLSKIVRQVSIDISGAEDSIYDTPGILST